MCTVTSAVMQMAVHVGISWIQESIVDHNNYRPLITNMTITGEVWILGTEFERHSGPSQSLHVVLVHVSRSYSPIEKLFWSNPTYGLLYYVRESGDDISGCFRLVVPQFEPIKEYSLRITLKKNLRN